MLTKTPYSTLFVCYYYELLDEIGYFSALFEEYAKGGVIY
jgi:hypothetical protein